ncbi:MAG: hypothetical protein ORN51_14570 [Akkermansiaceae bacterium]|nr:hypothetical protein [Akkermansiaceae bacterium]
MKTSGVLTYVLPDFIHFCLNDVIVSTSALVVVCEAGKLNPCREHFTAPVGCNLCDCQVPRALFI